MLDCLRQGMQSSFSSLPNPGGQTQLPYSSRTWPFSTGHTFAETKKKTNLQLKFRAKYLSELGLIFYSLTHLICVVFTFVTTDNRVSTISWETLAYHGSNWTGVQDFAHGVNTARFDFRAWIDALSVEARSLRWTFVVCFTFFFNCTRRMN